jgi:ADP-ribose pyrophosphatase YjhB (NUDIX family)
MTRKEGRLSVRTRAVILNDDGDILVQHHSGSGDDFYRPPGGGVRFHERLDECVVREIREETGLIVKVDRLLWVRDFLEESYDHSVELLFLATIVGGRFEGNREVEDGFEYLFMSLENLDKLIFYPESLIPKLKALRENSEWSEKNPYIGPMN